jgi:phosphoribosylformimino-5-aminoimidazole carboxamide ribonucleotide (ProFAR) isomerase
MSVRSCRVSIRDTEGIEHTAEVTAETLYEAVALGLRAIRQCNWVEDIGQNFTIRVLARDTPVEHTVEFRSFHKWLEQRGRTPSEITARLRIREILGLSKTV